MTFFLQKCDLANYTDDSTMHVSDKCVSSRNTSTIIDSLRHEFSVLSK